ncbi:MAG TPA: acyltransferase [Terrimicrobiaceae bacterium]
MNRDRGILILKAVAIIGVVFHHIHNRRLDSEAREWLSFLPPLFSWCVLMFLAISGWLHAMSDDKGVKPAREVITSRAMRLLLPFGALVFCYAVAWQILQTSGAVPLGGDVPSGFAAKIFFSLWPVHETVADQLYFLPMLFAISLVAHAILRLGGPGALGVLACSLFAAGIAFFPKSPNTGFLPGVFVWGLFSYAGGYLLFRFKSRRETLILLACCSAVIVLVVGVAGIAKVFPLIVLASMRVLRLASLPLLPVLGEASGTVYLYHQPFLLQTMLIGVAKLPTWQLQAFAALGAATLAMAICCAMYFALKRTRLRVILM